MEYQTPVAGWYAAIARSITSAGLVAWKLPDVENVVYGGRQKGNTPSLSVSLSDEGKIVLAKMMRHGLVPNVEDMEPGIEKTAAMYRREAFTGHQLEMFEARDACVDKLRARFLVFGRPNVERKVWELPADPAKVDEYSREFLGGSYGS